MVEPMTPDAALIRLRQYGERTKTWSTATYNDDTERALHQIATTLAAEVERQRGELAQIVAVCTETLRYTADTVRVGGGS